MRFVGGPVGELVGQLVGGEPVGPAQGRSQYSQPCGGQVMPLLKDGMRE